MQDPSGQYWLLKRDGGIVHSKSSAGRLVRYQGLHVPSLRGDSQTFMTQSGRATIAQSIYSQLIYYSMCLAIAAVSVHDGYLVIFNKKIAEDEQNPVGRWLIEAGSGGIHYFLAAKLTGTVIVTTVLLLLYWRKPRVAWFVCSALFVGQLSLLLYLTLG